MHACTIHYAERSGTIIINGVFSPGRCVLIFLGGGFLFRFVYNSDGATSLFRLFFHGLTTVDYGRRMIYHRFSRACPSWARHHPHYGVAIVAFGSRLRCAAARLAGSAGSTWRPRDAARRIH